MQRQIPLLRGTFHQAMFFIAVGACPLLIIKSSNASEYVATAIYSAADEPDAYDATGRGPPRSAPTWLAGWESSW